MSAARDLLIRAQKLIRKRGWTRYVQENKEGELCLIGALEKAQAELGLSDADGVVARIPLRALVRKNAQPPDSDNLRDDGICLPYWNDEMCARKEDVEDLLEEASRQV